MAKKKSERAEYFTIGLILGVGIMGIIAILLIS
jgi:hypothetical protein